MDMEPDKPERSSSSGSSTAQERIKEITDPTVQPDQNEAEGVSTKWRHSREAICHRWCLYKLRQRHQLQIFRKKLS